MKSKKKNKVNKKKGLLAGAGRTLRKAGTLTGLARLSTSQKVVGGLALATLGLRYLAKRRGTTPVADTVVSETETAE